MHAPSKMAQFPAQFDGLFRRVYSYRLGQVFALGFSRPVIGVSRF